MSLKPVCVALLLLHRNSSPGFPSTTGTILHGDSGVSLLIVHHLCTEIPSHTRNARGRPRVRRNAHRARYTAQCDIFTSQHRRELIPAFLPPAFDIRVFCCSGVLDWRGL